MLPQKVLILSDKADLPPPESRQVTSPKKYRFLVIGFGFVLLLLLPMLDKVFDWSANFKSTEKRILTPYPDFHFPRVRTFIYEFEQYFKENFGWRNALFYQYSHFKYGLIGASPLPDKVVIGKNGWFYPGNSVGRVVEQHRGLLPTPTPMLQSIVQRLDTYQQQLAKQGIKLYLLIAPDSYTVYPEYLPDYLAGAPVSANFDQVKQYLSQHCAVPLVDVRESLKRAKNKGVVYCQTDSHWNDYGSLVASLTLANRIRQDFPQLPVAQLSDYAIRTRKGSGGDLVTMLALNHQFHDSVDYRVKPAAKLRAFETERVANDEMGLPSQRFAGPTTGLPKLLLVGDSFSFSMGQFMPGYFGESYLVRSKRLDMRLVEQECPDVVVIEIVERNIPLLSQL